METERKSILFQHSVTILATDRSPTLLLCTGSQRNSLPILLSFALKRLHRILSTLVVLLALLYDLGVSENQKILLPSFANADDITNPQLENQVRVSVYLPPSCLLRMLMFAVHSNSMYIGVKAINDGSCPVNNQEILNTVVTCIVHQKLSLR
ncbi:expressed unknown protein [Seminavis robusta]|uniref:Uncharacterized protein n=1 Tax=Seminavis robusta TaxID=568900 RepID=A0A9N8EKT9_9STRA|nr:expressed unknown protein [Seminavis robusta]|eukprot:Sro1275_g258471.1  (152) ;mRNA; f:14831-15286